jgi:Recombination enhancement, RecA-dependent nuclease
LIRIGESRDAKRYKALLRIGCIACLIGGAPYACGRITIHHIVDKGYRKHSGGNLATIPLGEWHHQGIPYMDVTATFMRAMFGPSMELEKREFAKTYGTQRELLARVNEILEHA